MSRIFQIRELPTIIAGPCSAESLEQMRSVVTDLSDDSRISMIRCGVWKPRTRPGGFEGMGELALQWIKELKETFGNRFLFCCEVARTGHIELCQQYGIDAVWLGSRTTVNPFLVGELAEALKGSGLSVMVKNPITPDIELWVGALERLQRVGIVDLAAVHRGFTTYNNFGYRNNPLWELPIELKRRMPDVPLICDPSHIGGRRDLVAQLSQIALDMHFDGLMIECHPQPDKAVTDSGQQVVPSELKTILDNLKVRQRSETAPGDLIRMRQQLDIIDAQILKLLSQRMNISKDIGVIKSRHNMPLFQPDRWDQVLRHQIAAGKELGLDENFVKEVTEKIHGESLRQQENN